jgi:hypothetical protein
MLENSSHRLRVEYCDLRIQAILNGPRTFLSAAIRLLQQAFPTLKGARSHIAADKDQQRLVTGSIGESSAQCKRSIAADIPVRSDLPSTASIPYAERARSHIAAEKDQQRLVTGSIGESSAQCKGSIAADRNVRGPCFHAALPVSGAANFAPYAAPVAPALGPSAARTNRTRAPPGRHSNSSRQACRGPNKAS